MSASIQLRLNKIERRLDRFERELDGSPPSADALKRLAAFEDRLATVRQHAGMVAVESETRFRAHLATLPAMTGGATPQKANGPAFRSGRALTPLLRRLMQSIRRWGQKRRQGDPLDRGPS